MAKLIINPTAANRREIALSREGILTIGRDPSNDLVLPDAMVSRRHAVIEQRGPQFFLRDCNSANGSVVNGDRVSERGLRDGDLVAIGSMRLLFREEPAEPGAKVVPHPSAAPMQCPSCGADYRRGDLFCRECGGQVARPSGPPKAVCTSCGSAVPLPARFCNACGAVLPGSEQPPGPEPPAVSADPAGAGEEKRPSEDIRPVPRPAASAGPGRRPWDSAARAPALPSEAPLPRAPGELSPRVPPAIQTETPPPPARTETPPPSPVRAETPPPPPVRAEAPPPPPVRRSSPPRPAPARRPSPPDRPAGFGSRLAAGLVDAVFVLSGQAVILAPVAYYWWSRELPRSPGEVPFVPIVATVGLLSLAVLFGVLYHLYSWGVRGSSPGKELLELRVEAEDGTSPIGLGRAGLRLLGYLLSAASFGIGFLMIASGGDGLHDRIAGTRVVRRGRR